MSERPTLTVGITARDCAAVLPGRIEQARAFADEVIVGVNDASIDLTLEVASGLADVVYRFAQPLGFRAPRTLAITRTSCDWLLMLDDDETADAGLLALLPALLAGDETHWALPRFSLPDPLVGSTTEPSLADWQVRLVRADPSIAWEAPLPGGRPRVMGPGGREPRARLLHDGARAPQPSLTTPDVIHDTARVLPGIVEVGRLPRVPPWHATYTVRALAGEAEPGAILFAEIDARNTGGLHWPLPDDAVGGWPRLALVCRYTDDQGAPIDGTEQRFPLPAATSPGATVRFGCSIDLPARAGRHLLHWDMCSEGDVWFGDCGAEPATTMVRTRSRPGLDRRR